MAKVRKNSAPAALESKKDKPKRLQPKNFRLPKRISQEQASEIGETFGMTNQHAAELKDLLDVLVDDLHNWMPREIAANRPGDRDHIIKSGNWIRKAQNELKRLEIDGRLAVRSTAARLADILSSDWLRDHFPGKAPSRRVAGRGHPRSSRDPDLELRNQEKHSNYQFLRYQAPEALQALLRDLESVLASALASLDSDPQARGGLKRLPWRDNVIENLVIIWHRFGKTPVSTPNSEFARFCELVVEAMGWPSDGLDSAIPKAINNLLNPPKNRARLSK